MERLLTWFLLRRILWRVVTVDDKVGGGGGGQEVRVANGWLLRRGRYLFLGQS